MISVSNLSKKIGDVQALDGLSFHAEDGQITGLLGPNGAGKTTCLRTVFGLLQADQGIATINGIDVAIQPVEAKQQLGLFPDPFGIYERLTPREYIRYFAELSGLSRSGALDARTGLLMTYNS
jgi:sodium transport system ATP-binding protein